MFIDIAVSWDYLIDASTAAHSHNASLPILTKSGSWRLQAGTRSDATDHVAITEDVAGNSTPTASPKVWSSAIGGITVSPTSGLVTTEAGGTATFTVKLNTAPTADVTIGLTSSDLTEGTVSPDPSPSPSHPVTGILPRP